MKTGDMMFHGRHRDGGLINIADQDVRLVVVEFKPSKD